MITKSKKKEIKLTNSFEDEDREKPSLVQLVTFKLSELFLVRSKQYNDYEERYDLKWKKRFVGDVIITKNRSDIINICKNDKIRIKNLLEKLNITKRTMLKILEKDIKDYEKHMENVKEGNPVTFKVMYTDSKKAFICGSSKKDILSDIRKQPNIIKYKLIGDHSKGTVLIEEDL